MISILFINHSDDLQMTFLNQENVADFIDSIDTFMFDCDGRAMFILSLLSRCFMGGE